MSLNRGWPLENQHHAVFNQPSRGDVGMIGAAILSAGPDSDHALKLRDAACKSMAVAPAKPTLDA